VRAYKFSANQPCPVGRVDWTLRFRGTVNLVSRAVVGERQKAKNGVVFSDVDVFRFSSPRSLDEVLPGPEHWSHIKKRSRWFLGSRREKLVEVSISQEQKSRLKGRMPGNLQAEILSRKSGEN
jgi:hypothetical protein